MNVANHLLQEFARDTVHVIFRIREMDFPKRSRDLHVSSTRLSAGTN